LEDREFKAFVVRLILDGQTEKAIEELAEHYGVSTPTLRVGLPKKQKKRSLACYSPKDKAIFVSNSDALKIPFLILHEFYHHIRTGADERHRGNERYADEFAREFVRSAGYVLGRVKSDSP
jgi:hypothetical protein